MARYARRLIATTKGQIILDGPPREVFAHSEVLLRCGIRSPQATQLTQALDHTGIPAHLLDADEVATALRECIGAEVPAREGD